MVVSGLQLAAGKGPVSLAGDWGFQLDRADAGISERWYERTLPGRVRLPGDLSEQGIGDRPSLETEWIGGIQKPGWHLQPELRQYSTPENFKFPFWLTPERHYMGAAWFQRTIEIPRRWAGRRVVLTLERPHWETRVWVDGQPAGTNDALGTPHVYDLGQMAPGKHLLAIRVDNRMIIDVGQNSHSVSDHTQGNWNGIVGKIELQATPMVWIEELRAYPRLATHSVRVKGTLGNISGAAGNGTVTLTAKLKGGGSKGEAGATVQTLPVSWQGAGGSFEGELALGEGARPWDEFSPALYDLTAELRIHGLERDAATAHVLETVFGLREFATQGTQFLINGRKAFFRGTLECAIFPRTGHPPTDVASWRRIMEVCRAHGLNMIRFHSWCPPEAAFTAADEIGVYLHVECSAWANQSTTLGDGKPVDAWIYQEADRILKHYGNHPSFALMLYGNEPGGENFLKYLEKWVAAYKAKDSRRLYSSGAGWPQIAPNDFHLAPDPRIQLWGQGLKSRINAQPPETSTDYRAYINGRAVPVISHEIGQWCVYPNFAEKRKYTGYLKARNFEIFQASLAGNHLGGQARQFLRASGKLQALCYKEDIESALRTPGMGGFQLLDLHDFPGQGTALVGVLDPFWEEKGYITPGEYSRFCNSTVPLVRLAKRVFMVGEQLEADVEVAHFGPKPINARTTWRLVGADGKRIAAGHFPETVIPVDNGIKLGRIAVGLGAAASPQRCKLVVAIEESGATSRTGLPGTHENDWDIWVYPPKVNTEAAPDLAVVDDLDGAALAKLEAGEKVLLLIPPARVRNLETNKVVLGFSSIFWNTAWTRRQPPTTLGILCDPKHPALARFPTEFHSNWQWWHIISRAGAMILDGMPATLQPTVQVIDDWVTNHRLALLFEARLGKGKLMVCSIDLKNELESDPVRRQFRHSVLRYMEGKRFAPTTTVTADQVRGLIAPAKQIKNPKVLPKV